MDAGQKERDSSDENAEKREREKPISNPESSGS